MKTNKCDIGSTEDIDNYATSSSFAIRREGESTSFINVFLSYEEEESNAPGFCQTILAAGIVSVSARSVDFH